MGGFAVAIEWVDALDPAGFDRMVTAIAHRGTAGMRKRDLDGISVAEARFTRDGGGGWDIETDGRYTIVGDIRLWNTEPLTDDLGPANNDRALLLSAYAEMGSDMMDLVDGDFAFAIWDNEKMSLFAARDRFGTKPLFYATTPSGIRLGTEARQVASFGERAITADDLTVARFLNGEFAYDERTFFDGVSRVMPSEVLTANAEGTTRDEYWTLESNTDANRDPEGVADAFREELTDAVRRRTDGSDRTMSHLSGGLDSSAIAASAALLTGDSLDHEAFVTVSAVFPRSEVDESDFIAETVAMQPFEHREFTPRIGSIDCYAQDMANTGVPVAHQVRDLTAKVREIANEESADLVLTGNGGDDVVNDAWVLTALLKRGSLKRWFDATRQIRKESSSAADTALLGSVARSLPKWAKAPLRRIRGDMVPSISSLLSEHLRTVLDTTPSSTGGSPGTMAEGMARDLASGRRLVLLEMQEAMFAANGVEVSHPFLDRTLVEFVANTDPESRPMAASSKALIRQGFAGYLPDAVLTKQAKTIGNPLIIEAIGMQGAAFDEQFPAVPDQAAAYVDAAEYSKRVEALTDAKSPLVERMQLWSAWSLMLWLVASELER